MHKNKEISLFIICLLTITVKLDSINTTSNQTGIIHPSSLELLNITSLLQSLNTTYRDLAVNLSILDSSHNLSSYALGNASKLNFSNANQSTA
jgi:hypothetical protein